MQFDGPPPILRAVEMTAQSSEKKGNQVDTFRFGSVSHVRSTPQVRRMRLKSEDVCVIMGSSALWKWLTPEEVVTIVGQNMHRMASDAADAVIAEVRRRMGDPSMSESDDELTFIVLYLAGENYVK